MKIFIIILVAILMILMIPSTTHYERQEDRPPPEYPVMLTAIITAYTSTPEETDDTPFLTASGETVGEGVAACPARFEFGTVIEVAGRVYRCLDRMAERFRHSNHFDLWYADRREAIEFGRRNMVVAIRQEQ